MDVRSIYLHGRIGCTCMKCFCNPTVCCELVQSGIWISLSSSCPFVRDEVLPATSWILWTNLSRSVSEHGARWGSITGHIISCFVTSHTIYRPTFVYILANTMHVDMGRSI